jgi:hypothetical protein
MRKKSNTDVIEMISRFQRTILENKPSKDIMYDEVRMMKFKIKPVLGDISILNLSNNNFIEILWSLGKIDEFFQKQVDNLNADQRDIFYKLLDEIYEKYQDDLNTIDLKKQDTAPSSPGFEMEIYKEKTPKAN